MFRETQPWALSPGAKPNSLNTSIKPHQNVGVLNQRIIQVI